MLAELKKVRFPRAVLPLSVVMGNTLQFALALPVIAGFLFVSGHHPAWSWLPGIPLLFALQLTLTAGIALLVASFCRALPMKKRLLRWVVMASALPAHLNCRRR